MSVTFEEPIGVAELIAQFTGVEHEDGGWITAPVYSAQLVAAVCRHFQPVSEAAIVKYMFGEVAADDVPVEARLAVTVGFTNWRRGATVGRGL